MVEIITPQNADLEKKQTAEEANAAFHAKLQAHVLTFEKTVNALPNTQSAILFCGAVEKIAADFKEIFLTTWREELYQANLSNGQVKKSLIRIEEMARGILTAKHTKPA